MAKDKPEPVVIYLVGDLKQAFGRVRDTRVREMQQEPLPKDSKCLADNSPCQQRAIEATKSLELLKHFADDAFIGLQAVPGELADCSQENAQPFHRAYVTGACEILTSERLKNFASRIQSLE